MLDPGKLSKNVISVLGQEVQRFPVPLHRAFKGSPLGRGEAFLIFSRPGMIGGGAARTDGTGACRGRHRILM